MSGLLPLTDIQPDAVEPVEIPYGEWTPDQADIGAGVVEVLNVIPGDGSYVPFPQHEVNQNRSPLIDGINGAYAVVTENDTVQLYVALNSQGIWTDITGDWAQIGASSVNDQFSYQFIRMGGQLVLTHPDVFPSRATIGTSAITYVAGAANTAPKAGCGAAVGDHLVFGNLYNDPDDGNGAFPSRIRWGGANNIDAPWVSDPITRADFQDMPAEGGPVVAIAGREVGTIFQARMISTMRPVATTEVYSITHLEKRGAIARDCVVDLGPYKFFIAEDGFFTWNGTNSAPIADAKVNKYFFSRLEYSRRHRIVGAADLINGCIMWAFPIDTSGALSEIIIYSYRENKWSHSIQTIDYLLSSAASNVTLDELTDPLESYTISFDDPTLRRGGRARLGAFNQQHAYGLYTGAPMDAIIDTGEYSGPNNRRVTTNGVRPLVDLATPVATVQSAERDQMIGQPSVFSAAVAQELDGVCPILAEARYTRYRTNLPLGASWEHAVGVEVFRKAGGVY